MPKYAVSLLVPDFCDHVLQDGVVRRAGSHRYSGLSNDGEPPRALLGPLNMGVNPSGVDRRGECLHAPQHRWPGERLEHLRAAMGPAGERPGRLMKRDHERLIGHEPGGGTGGSYPGRPFLANLMRRIVTPHTPLETYRAPSDSQIPLD